MKRVLPVILALVLALSSFSISYVTVKCGRVKRLPDREPGSLSITAA